VRRGLQRNGYPPEILNKNIGKNGIVKPWKYVVLPTERITISSTVLGLIN